MPNNGKPRSLKNIFQNQPNGAKAETLNASVRQDKARKNSARIGTPQPAPHENSMRAHFSRHNGGGGRVRHLPPQLNHLLFS
jgi:hypothetical protein